MQSRGCEIPAAQAAQRRSSSAARELTKLPAGLDDRAQRPEVGRGRRGLVSGQAGTTCPHLSRTDAAASPPFPPGTPSVCSARRKEPCGMQSRADARRSRAGGFGGSGVPLRERLVATPPGLEPGQTGPKPVVLPLHHGVSRLRVEGHERKRADTIAGNRPISSREAARAIDMSGPRADIAVDMLQPQPGTVS